MKARIALLLSILLCPLTAFASFNWNWNLNPYVGIDGAWRHWEWEPDFGDNHFNKSYQNVSPFIGLKLNRYLSIEGGYEQTNRAQRQAFYNGNDVSSTDPVLGFLRPVETVAANIAVMPTLFISESEMRGMHLSAIGEWPFFKNLSVYALAGATWMRFYVNTLPIANVDPLDPPDIGAGVGSTFAAQRVVSWHSDRILVPRFGFGFKQMVSSNFAARIFALWEDVGSLEGTTPGNGKIPGTLITSPASQNDNYTVRSKKSTLVGMGLVYYFSPQSEP